MGTISSERLEPAARVADTLRDKSGREPRPAHSRKPLPVASDHPADEIPESVPHQVDRMA